MRQKAYEEHNRLNAAQTKRLKNYAKQLSTDRDRVMFDKFVLRVLRKYRKKGANLMDVLSYLNSIGFSQANYTYKQIEDQLDRFLEGDHKDFRWNKFYQEQKAAMLKEFASWQLSQVEYHDDDDIRNVLPKHDTHAGFEYILTGVKNKGEYMTDGVAAQYLEKERLAKEEGSFNNIIMIGTRTQASGAFDKDNDYKYTGTYKKKSRLVSMVRLWLILAECKFARPLQERLGYTNWYAGGKDDNHIHQCIITMRKDMPHSVTIDYSHYDQSISSWLIRDAFEIMEAAFVKHNFDRELFHIIREDMVHKYFIDGKGKLRESWKGVCSGSMFTQLVDSIVNRLMIGTYMRSRSIQFNCLIMGDDNLIYSREKVNVEDLCSYLFYNFGIETNPDKCSTTEGIEAPEFLSRTWTFEGVWRHPNELISKILFPERFRDYRNGADANLIIYAYCLSFPLGMKQLMDVEAFVRDNALEREILRNSKKRKYLSGLMRYRLDYAI